MSRALLAFSLLLLASVVIAQTAPPKPNPNSPPVATQAPVKKNPLVPYAGNWIGAFEDKPWILLGLNLTGEQFSGSLQRAKSIDLNDSHPPSSARCQSLTAVGVTAYLATPAMHFVGDGLDFFECQRRLRNQVAILIRPRAMRHIHLDPVGAMFHLLASRLAGLYGTNQPVCTPRARNFDFRSIAFKRVAAGGGYSAGRGEDARAGNAIPSLTAILMPTSP